jgi:hypothetical protein
MAEIYRAKEAFAFTGKDGVPQVIRPGDLMSDGDANFKGKEQLFEKVEVAAQRAVDRPKGNVENASAEPKGKVEEATAEPNAKRSVSTVKTTRSKGE